MRTLINTTMFYNIISLTTVLLWFINGISYLTSTLFCSSQLQQQQIANLEENAKYSQSVRVTSSLCEGFVFVTIPVDQM